MDKNLKDIEFMLSVNSDTRNLILRFYDALDDGDVQHWINSFNDVKNSLFDANVLNQLEIQDDTSHKKCLKLFQSQTMTENNAKKLRHDFLQLKNEFEAIN